jgi:hypothetical protein
MGRGTVDRVLVTWRHLRWRSVAVAVGVVALVVSGCSRLPGTTVTASAQPTPGGAPSVMKSLEPAPQPSAPSPVDPSSVPEPPVTGARGAPMAPSADDLLLAALDRTSTGVVWDACAPEQPTAGSLAESWCDNDSPPLQLKVVFNLYDDDALLQDSVSGVYQDATGDTSAGCETGGKAVEARNLYTVACGYMVFDGTTYYTLAWRNTDKLVRGQIWDTDPQNVWRWWYGNTPF